MSDFKQKIEAYIEASPFIKFAGFKLTKLDNGVLEGDINLIPMFRRHDNIAHGGFLSYFCDSLMGLSALSTVDFGTQTVVTAEMKVTYLNPGKGDVLSGIGTVIKRGKTLIFCESEVFTIAEDGSKTICCKATATMCIIDLNR